MRYLKLNRKVISNTEVWYYSKGKCALEPCFKRFYTQGSKPQLCPHIHPVDKLANDGHIQWMCDGPDGDDSDVELDCKT